MQVADLVCVCAHSWTFIHTLRWMLQLALGGSDCHKDQCWWEERRSCNQRSNWTAHAYRWPLTSEGCGIGVDENLRWSGGGWGGFSRLTGVKTSVRSSTWRPSAPDWSMTEVSQDFDPLRIHLSESITGLCLVSLNPLWVFVLVEQGGGRQANYGLTATCTP